MIDSNTISSARAVRVASEIHRRGIKLRASGKELIGPCPVCGDGGKGWANSDRFAVHTGKNIWHCRQCPAGGGVIDLVMHLDAVGFPEAVDILTDSTKPFTAPQCTTSSPPVISDEEGRRWALNIWKEGGPIAGTIAEHYLASVRRLEIPDDISPRVLRFHSHCPFGGGGNRLPCLLALYRDIHTDAPRAIMRTALAPDGTKIERKALGPRRGAAIKITASEDVSTGLAIGEGLETTIAGMMLGFSPAWSVGNAGAISTFPVLPGIETLIVLGETDADGANERASNKCAARWLTAGREFFRATPEDGGDFNDPLMMIKAA